MTACKFTVFMKSEWGEINEGVHHSCKAEKMIIENLMSVDVEALLPFGFHWPRISKWMSFRSSRGFIRTLISQACILPEGCGWRTWRKLPALPIVSCLAIRLFAYLNWCNSMFKWCNRKSLVAHAFRDNTTQSCCLPLISNTYSGEECVKAESSQTTSDWEKRSWIKLYVNEQTGQMYSL